MSEELSEKERRIKEALERRQQGRPTPNTPSSPSPRTGEMADLVEAVSAPPLPPLPSALSGQALPFQLGEVTPSPDEPDLETIADELIDDEKLILSESERQHVIKTIDQILSKKLLGKTIAQHLVVGAGAYSLKLGTRLILENTFAPGSTIILAVAGAGAGGYRGYVNEKYRQKEMAVELTRQQLKGKLLSDPEARNRMIKAVALGALIGGASAFLGAELAHTEFVQSLINKLPKPDFSKLLEILKPSPESQLIASPSPTSAEAPLKLPPKPEATPTLGRTLGVSEAVKPQPTTIPKPTVNLPSASPLSASEALGDDPARAAGTLADPNKIPNLNNIPQEGAYSRLVATHPEAHLDLDAPAALLGTNEMQAKIDVFTDNALREAGFDLNRVPKEARDKVREVVLHELEIDTQRNFDYAAQRSLQINGDININEVNYVASIWTDHTLLGDEEYFKDAFDHLKGNAIAKAHELLPNGTGVVTQAAQGAAEVGVGFDIDHLDPIQHLTPEFNNPWEYSRHILKEALGREPTNQEIYKLTAEVCRQTDINVPDDGWKIPGAFDSKSLYEGKTVKVPGTNVTKVFKGLIFNDKVKGVISEIKNGSVASTGGQVLPKAA